MRENKELKNFNLTNRVKKERKAGKIGTNPKIVSLCSLIQLLIVFIGIIGEYHGFIKKYSNPPNSGWKEVMKGEVYWGKFGCDF